MHNYVDIVHICCVIMCFSYLALIYFVIPYLNMKIYRS